MDWGEIGENVRHTMALRGLRADSLAAQCGVTDRTIRRLLSGKSIRLDTLTRVQHTLGLDSKKQSVEGEVSVSDEQHGAYHRKIYGNYCGLYYGFRRSFSHSHKIVVSALEIHWSDETDCLVFHEEQRNKSENGRTYRYSLSGEIFVPPGAGILNFVVIDKGAVRLAALSHLRENLGNTMQGIVLTLTENTLPIYQPAASAIIYQKLPADLGSAKYEELKGEIGVFGVDNPFVREKASLLDEVEQHFAIIGRGKGA